MSFRHREIESKLQVRGLTLNQVNEVLQRTFEGEISKSLFGSSTDTYWIVGGNAEADFIRMRERDGIRQITCKGKDRGDNLNRLEVDVDSTSDVRTITRLLNACHGKPAGKVEKTYYVYWLGKSEYTTVCCYEVTVEEQVFPDIFIEVETTQMEKMLALEARVIWQFNTALGGICIQRAPGSLFELFIAQQLPEKGNA